MTGIYAPPALIITLDLDDRKVRAPALIIILDDRNIRAPSPGQIFL